MEEMQLLHLMESYLEGINQKRWKENIYHNKLFVYNIKKNCWKN